MQIQDLDVHRSCYEVYVGEQGAVSMHASTIFFILVFVYVYRETTCWPILLILGQIHIDKLHVGQFLIGPG